MPFLQRDKIDRFVSETALSTSQRNKITRFVTETPLFDSQRDKIDRFVSETPLSTSQRDKIDRFVTETPLFDSQRDKITIFVTLACNHVEVWYLCDEGIRAREVGMKSRFEQESLCDLNFRNAGMVWHVWTDENHPIIFSSIEDFKAGMTIMGITARLFPEIKIYTFELMSNHIHIVVAGSEDLVRRFFQKFKQLLANYLNGGRYGQEPSASKQFVDLKHFNCSIRAVETLFDLRNVIAYTNRNGYLVSPDHTPFSYPWGANRYYFCHGAFNHSGKYLTCRERTSIIHSHVSDSIASLRAIDGYACPSDFCSIAEGEGMFLGASHYFHIISRSVESFKSIAKDISERVFYTDDELFTAIFALARKKYGLKINELDKDAKTDLAKTMHYDYNAGNKQIARILSIPASFVDALFPQSSSPNVKPPLRHFTQTIE